MVFWSSSSPILDSDDERSWKVDQILGLAPDSASAKAGQGFPLPLPPSGSNLGQKNRPCGGNVWDRVRAPINPNRPFRTRFQMLVSLAKVSLQACVGFVSHAWPQGPGHGGSPPDWVTKWLQSRQERRKPKRKSRKTGHRRSRAQAKRAGGARQKGKRRIEEVRTWLFDLVRSGLAQIPAGAARLNSPAPV